jgi:prepilin-type N-terminal cleavage/methylation domain-containing protein
MRCATRSVGQAGLTLIELMISMTILSIAVAAAFTMGYTMINGYRESRRTVAVERAARGAMTFVSTAVRSASAGVETGDITDAVGCNSWKGLEVINETDAPDELRVIYASGAVVTSLRSTVDQDSTTLVVVDGSQLSQGDGLLLITPGVAGHFLAVEATSDNGDETWTVDLAQAASAACPAVPPFSYGVGSMVLRAKLAHFFVDDDGGLPMLMMDPDGAGDAEPEPVAEGIEDLQVAVGVDLDDDGSLLEVGGAADDDEWFHNVDGDSAPPDVVARPWRALRLTLTARSLVTTSAATDSLRPPAEDREVATAGDAFRRRSLSTTIEIRNLRGSP